MIYSSIEDNWFRVQQLHKIAFSLWQQTNNSEFRQRILKCGDTFPFDAIAYDKIKEEICIVEMLMSWAVMTIESLMNHVLADKIQNRTLAITAIEYPNKITESLKIKKSCISELAKKCIILHDDITSTPAEIITLADDISIIRNSIVHDKPFELTFDGEDEHIIHYRIRENDKPYKCHYETLSDFFTKCDKIVIFILAKSNLSEEFDTNILNLRFISLLDS